jgi:nitroreductase
MNVSDALRSRISTRAFRPDPVTEATLREILDAARWAPSGGNLQPWRVLAVSGREIETVVALAKGNLPGDPGPRFVYPDNLWEPYRSRRFEVGEQMYAILGIPREDKAGRLRQFERNFEFFEAPVALFFIIDERMGYGQWAHLGMFMQSIALAALERGVATCMQECWAMLRKPLHTHFALAESEMVYCGMAMGYADTDAPINKLRSSRADVDEIAEFRGF